jgi:hypothetical protein
MSNWIEWNGGACPVPAGTRVDVRHKDGCVHFSAIAGSPGPACWWDHDDHEGDITSYRLTTDEQTADHGEVCEVGL